MPSYEEKMRADVENVIDDSLAKLTNGAEVDLSHHLSRQGVARGASPIKDLFKYASIPGKAARHNFNEARRNSYTVKGA